jgi:methanogenic corrinoid protein MtbC1
LADRVDADVIDARIIAAAMTEVGRLWEAGAVSIADEHVATGIASRAAALAVSAVAHRDGFRRGPAQSRTALLATVEGEQHGLGLRMVADMLHLHGVETRFLGTNVPSRELCAFASLMQPDTIALSLSLTARAPALVKQVEALRSASPKAAFLIGGQGASTALADRIGASYMKDVEVLVGKFRPAGKTRTEVFESAPNGALSLYAR